MAFHNFMQNSSVGAANPHIEFPDLTPKKAEAAEVSFSGESFKWVQKAVEDYGFENPAELINAALQLATPIMEAQSKGFSRMLLVKDETEEVIQIPLTDDTELPESDA